MELRRDRHILIVRTDRIGDVLLTLPVANALRSHDARVRLSMWIREYTRELAEGQCGVSRVLLDDEEGVRKPFLRILRELRAGRFDVAIVAYPRFRIALLLWAAGIPVRIGTGYRWYSFLFNERVFEHRREGKKSEAAYNLGLLGPLGIPSADPPRVTIEISPAHVKFARALRRTLGIGERNRVVVLHPGSGGSAREWPVERFGVLASSLAQRGYRVVVVGLETERALVDRVCSFGGSNIRPLIGGQSLLEYAAFIRMADLFVANSTGPLHLAAAVGTPVIGFYPNDRVMGPVRWGPLTAQKTIFVPRRSGCAPCDAGSCGEHVSMQLIPVDAVVAAAEKMLRRAPRRGGLNSRRTPKRGRTRPRATVGRRSTRSK